ncbi:MAG: hypothetical protein H6Q66_1180 [Firmicutes bacterium]|nr:hypothetical protein [Bacillota bacterium]
MDFQENNHNINLDDSILAFKLSQTFWPLECELVAHLGIDKSRISEAI